MDIKRPCEECFIGIMEQSNPPDSGDWNEDGFLEFFCNICGYGYKQFNMLFGPYSQNKSNGLSKRKIRKVVDKVFTRQNLPYNEKTTTENEIFDSCFTNNDVIFFLYNVFNEDLVFLKNQLLE